MHIRLDLVEFASQMVLFSKFRVDTAENGPVKVEKVQFSKYHFSPLSTNFWILSSFKVRTRRDLAPGTENFPKIYSIMTKFFFQKWQKWPKMRKNAEKMQKILIDFRRNFSNFERWEQDHDVFWRFPKKKFKNSLIGPRNDLPEIAFSRKMLIFHVFLNFRSPFQPPKNLYF